MKKTIIPFYPLSYPVGSNIKLAIDFTKAIAKLFINEERDITLWVKGSSGAILGALFSSALLSSKYKGNIQINHIKKEGEQSHSSNISFWVYPHRVNIILDDFISTGATIASIEEVIIDSAGYSEGITEVYLLVSTINWMDIPLYNIITHLITNDEGHINYKIMLQEEYEVF